MTDRASGDEDGTMLIEVLVAFVILASAIIMAFQIFGDGLRRMNTVEPKMLAMAIARKELARIGSQTGTAPARLEGADESGMRWQMIFDPLNSEEADWTSLRPFRVRMWIGTDIGGEPILETVVLAQVPKT